MKSIPVPTIAALRIVLVLCLAALAAVRSTAAEPFKVLVFGDSLSAAYGMQTSAGWVALLRERVADRGIDVVNRSVSGETTAGGVQRLPAAIDEVNPDLVIIELGANDGLRGIDPGAMRDNLARMIEVARDADAEILLLGMKMPPNYGPQYTAAFEAVYAGLAETQDVYLVPFFLATVAEDWDLMQDDGNHPNERAQPKILDHVWTSLEPLLPRG